MNILTQALRNVFRNARRSLLTIAGIVAGITSILVLGGYYEYNYWGLRESLIHSQLGHIQISMPHYESGQSQRPFDYLIPDYQKLVQWLDKQPEVDVCSPHLEFWGVIDTGSHASSLVKVSGMIPERDNQINTFFTKKLGMDLFSRDSDAAELGYSLATAMGIQVGDRLSISTVAANGSQNALEFQAKSLIGSYSTEFDSRMVRLPLAAAASLAGVEGVQQIVVLLKSSEATSAFKQRLQRELPGLGWYLTVSSWDERSGYYGQVVEFYGGYFRIILTIVALVAFFSTLNTMVMAIFERSGEIGTMRSFGSTNGRLLALFLSEGAAIGLISTIAGIALACGLSALINGLGGIAMAPPPGITSQVQVKIMVSPANLLIAAAIGCLVPLLASLIPSLQSLRSQIIDQIRHNN